MSKNVCNLLNMLNRFLGVERGMSIGKSGILVGGSDSE